MSKGHVAEPFGKNKITEMYSSEKYIVLIALFLYGTIFVHDKHNQQNTPSLPHSPPLPTTSQTLGHVSLENVIPKYLSCTSLLVLIYTIYIQGFLHYIREQQGMMSGY